MYMSMHKVYLIYELIILVPAARVARINYVIFNPHY